MNMKITFPGGLGVNAAFKGFTVATDQAAEHGGGGTAPEPFNLFLASLGTCAGFYALRFCQQRGIATQGLGLTVTTQRDAEGKRLALVRLAIEAPGRVPREIPRRRDPRRRPVRGQTPDPGATQLRGGDGRRQDAARDGAGLKPVFPIVEARYLAPEIKLLRTALRAGCRRVARPDAPLEQPHRPSGWVKTARLRFLCYPRGDGSRRTIA